MTQERAAELAAKEAISNKVVASLYYWELIDLFKMVYAIGFDEGRKLHNHSKRVIQFTAWGERVAVYESATKGAEAVGLTKYMISKCATGKNRTAGGFIWRYEDAVENSG